MRSRFGRRGTVGCTSRVTWNTAARELELPSCLGHQRALRIGENQVLEMGDRSGRVPFASQRASPLELRLRCFGSSSLLLHETLPEDNRLGVVLEGEAELSRR